MPEIAEVRRYVDQLTTEYSGQELNGVKVVGGRFLNEDTQGCIDILNFPMKDVTFNAKGKFIYWSMTEKATDAKIHFFITLGMAGSFGKLNKHSALEFTFEKDVVYFNNIRHFGTFKIIYGDKLLLKKLKSLGWDSLQNPKMPPEIIPQLRNKNNKTIAEVLMDQKIFAGVGNYIRSEVLYLTSIHPNTIIRNLSDNQLGALCENIISVANDAYLAGGATIRTYSDLYGNVGTFYNQFKVYGQKKDPYGNEVSKLTAADGRTVHYVKSIQI